MEINRSEIWYTYSTYYTGDIIPLEAFAEIVLQTNITECVYSSDESYKVKIDKSIVTKEVNAEFNSEMTQGSFNIKDWPDSAFVKEGLYQNCINSYFEKKLLNLDGKYIDNSYIRFSTEEMIIEFNDRRRKLYPIFTIYTSGIIILEFRTIYDSKIRIDDFINSCVHFSRLEFVKCFTNKQLSLMAKKLNDKNYNCEVIKEEGGDFEFELYEYHVGNKNKTLTSVANTIFESFIVLFNLIHKSGNYEIGNIWFHKPHVHLLKYSNQKNTATECIDKNSDSIKKIMLMISSDINKYIEPLELKNLRQFNDFARFYNSGVTLTIWSKDGLKGGSQGFDPNYNHCIYHSEVTDRFLDYINILFEQSFNYIYTCKSYELLLYHQKSYYLLENDFLHLSKYGEIEDMLNYARKVLKIAEKAQNSLSLLDLRKNEIDYNKNQKITVFSIILTIVFGIISVGAFSNDLISPLYNIIGFPKFKSCNGNQVLLWAISFIIISLAIYITYKVVGRKKKI